VAASCGLGAAALALLVPILGGGAEPGYSHAAPYLGELGASGAANAGLVSAAGFAPIGALTLGFLALASGLFPRSRRALAGALCLSAVGAAYLAASAFPCDAGCPGTGSRSQSIHNAFGLLEYAGAVVGLVLLGSAFRADAPWRSLSRLSFRCAVVVGAGFAAMSIPQLEPVRGLSQRVAEAAIFVWVAAVSAFLLWVRPGVARSDP
jgi:hypothetical protein